MLIRKRLTAFLSFLLLCGISAFAGRNDRGIISLKGDRTPFALKNGWVAGGSIGYNEYRADNFTLAIIDGIRAKGYGISVKPAFLYTVADDFAIGIQGIYSRDGSDIVSAGLSIKDISLNVKDFDSISQKFGGAFLCRKYFPLGNTGRFAIYIDGRFGYEGGQSKISNNRSGKIVGTYQTSNSISLGVNPGLSMYLTPHMVMGVGLGIVGFGFDWVEQIHNQVARGSRDGFAVSYILNPLALSLGVYYSF